MSQCATKVLMTLKKSFVDTNEKVFIKLMSSFYIKSIVISHTLYFPTLPSEYCLNLNINLQPTCFTSSDNGMTSQTLLSYIDFNPLL